MAHKNQSDLKGIICIDKPQNITSFSCCAVFKRLLNTGKIGHGGTLDPMATGVLPLLIGRATKALDILPSDDKEYLASLKFGYTSNTGDIWGESVAPYKPPSCGEIKFPDIHEIEAAFSRFRGDIMQIPPMVSAIKKDGVRLYELARQGIEVERKARKVTVYQLEIINYNKNEGTLSFRCLCSAGTYIRTICTDLGDIFRLGAVMTDLRRTISHGFKIENTLSFERAKELSFDDLKKHIIPTAEAFACYPSLSVSSAQATRFKNGGELDSERISGLEKNQDGELFRIYGAVEESSKDGFLGIGELKNGSIWVKKLL